MIQSAYGEGVRARKGDDLVHALWLTGIHKSKLSRICQKLKDRAASV